MKIIDNATVQVDAEYDENTKNSDGSVLSDLAYSSVYYLPAGSPAPIMGAKSPATSPNGGGHIKATLIIPAPANAKTSIDFWATETDSAGNEGPPSTHITFVVDRIAPAAPVGFTIA